MRSIWRYEIPVDDQPHKFQLNDWPTDFGLKRYGTYSFAVEFWSYHDDNAPTFDITYLVVGTGHEIPYGYFVVGTAPRDPETGLVFHVVELQEEE